MLSVGRTAGHYKVGLQQPLLIVGVTFVKNIAVGKSEA